MEPTSPEHREDRQQRKMMKKRGKMPRRTSSSGPAPAPPIKKSPQKITHNGRVTRTPTGEITWKRGMPHRSISSGATTSSRRGLPEHLPFPDDKGSRNSLSSSSGSSNLAPTVIMMGGSSSSSNQRIVGGTSFVSRQSHISVESDFSESLLDDDFIMSASVREQVVDDNEVKDDPRSPVSFWKSKSRRLLQVDQGVNLMDAEKGKYEKSPAPGINRGLGLRQKSLVEIFLQDDSANGASRRGMSIVGDRGLVSVHKKGGGRSLAKCCFAIVFWSLLLVGALVLALPSMFGDRTQQPDPVNPAPSSNLPSNTDPAQAVAIEQEFTSAEEDEQIRHPPESLNTAAIPTQSRRAAVQFLAIDQDISMAESFLDPESPSSKALAWISEEDPAQPRIPGNSDADDAALLEQWLMQRYSLAAFYFSQVGPGDDDEDGSKRRLLEGTDEEWKRRERFERHWMTEESVCHWPGVQCDSDLLVTALDVSHSLLGGTLPVEIMRSSGFPAMVMLDLSHNQLHGTLPRLYQSNADTGHLMPPFDNRLESLLLQNNLLEGNIDPIITLRYLKNLDLSSNKFTGSIPGEVISKLEQLEFLQLATNKLQGRLPTQLSALSQLTHIDLEGNSFTGRIPSAWSSLAELHSLSLAHNSIRGTIPSALANLSGMQHLRLQNTKLAGSIPSFLGDFVQLKELYLHNTDMEGTMPEEICSLANGTGLEVLTSDCSKLIGKVTCNCCTDCLLK